MIDRDVLNDNTKQIDNKATKPRISVRNLNFFYCEKQALFDNNIDIAKNRNPQRYAIKNDSRLFLFSSAKNNGTKAIQAKNSGL